MTRDTDTARETTPPERAGRTGRGHSSPPRPVPHYREIADAEWAEKMARLGGGNHWRHEPPRPPTFVTASNFAWALAMWALIALLVALVFGAMWWISPVEAVVHAGQVTGCGSC